MSIDVVEVVIFLEAEDGIRGKLVTGVQTCALPISGTVVFPESGPGPRFDIALEANGYPAQRAIDAIGLDMKIGRASCRERGRIIVSADVVEVIIWRESSVSGGSGAVHMFLRWQHRK